MKTLPERLNTKPGDDFGESLAGSFTKGETGLDDFFKNVGNVCEADCGPEQLA